MQIVNILKPNIRILLSFECIIQSSRTNFPSSVFFSWLFQVFPTKFTTNVCSFFSPGLQSADSTPASGPSAIATGRPHHHHGPRPGLHSLSGHEALIMAPAWSHFISSLWLVHREMEQVWNWEWTEGNFHTTLDCQRFFPETAFPERGDNQQINTTFPRERATPGPS